jgi:hypothetical protein
MEEKTKLKRNLTDEELDEAYEVKKRGKITLSFTSPDFFFKKFCYEVLAKQRKKK